MRSIPRTVLHLTLLHCSRPPPPSPPPPSHFNYLAQLEGKKSGERGEGGTSPSSSPPPSTVADTAAAISFSLFPLLLFSSFYPLPLEAAAVGLSVGRSVGLSVGTGGSLVKITSSCVMCLSLPSPFFNRRTAAAARTEEGGEERRGECCRWIGA